MKKAELFAKWKDAKLDLEKLDTILSSRPWKEDEYLDLFNYDRFPLILAPREMLLEFIEYLKKKYKKDNK